MRSLNSISVLLLMFLGSMTVAAQTAQPKPTPPPPAPPRSVEFPKPVESTLANGLRVIVVERPNSPLVAAQIVIRNGGEVDPDGLSGLADLTAGLLTKGTEKRSAPDIAEAIEALGGSLDSGAGWDSSRASVNVLSSKVAPAMEILADIVRRPTFHEEELERLRQQYRDNITLEMGNPGSIARYVAARVVFGDAPYGHPLSGTSESIAKITRGDIVKLHAAYYRPDNAILVFGGDIKAKDAFSLAERFFGDWKKPATPLPAAASGSAKAETTNKARVVVVDKPDAGQAAVVVARTGINRRHPDYYSGIVANSVLSGYSGRLNQEIRIKRGLSYGAGSTLETRRDIGPFAASAQTKNESGAEVAALLIGEVGRLATAPLPDAELVPRKAVLMGGFSRNLETVTGIVAQVAALALHDLSLDEINRYIASVQAVTEDDVRKFASSRLGADGTNIIIVGNAKAFLPELSKQYKEIEVIPLGELDLNSGQLRRAPTSATQ